MDLQDWPNNLAASPYFLSDPTTYGPTLDGLYLEMWITLNGPLIQIRYKASEYMGVDRGQNAGASGNEATPGSNLWGQANPCAYFDGQFSNVHSYKGSNPWAMDATTQETSEFLSVGGVLLPTEKWVANINSSGFGIGLYSPDSDAGSFVYALPSYEAGAMFNVTVVGFNFTPYAVCDQTVTLTIGDLSNIRSRFYTLAGHTLSNNPLAHTVRISSLQSGQTGVRIGKLAAGATGVRIR
jgi:hypothetical protein